MENKDEYLKLEQIKRIFLIMDKLNFLLMENLKAPIKYDISTTAVMFS